MLAGFALAGALLAGSAVLCGRVWQGILTRPGPLAQDAAIVVPHGGASGVAQALLNAGVIGSPLLFKAAVWVSAEKGPLHAAELAFPAHASLAEVLAVLRTARPVQHHLTIAEGLTAQQIAAVIAQADAASGAAGAIAEGSLLPETYDYERGTDRAVLVGRAKAAMDRVLQAAWAARAPDLPLGSMREALILASIVERETAKPEERPHIAAVYLNRLRQGMRLEADPTVAYAASNGSGVLDHRLSRTDLRRDDPYNSYRFAGLPPGPICSPGQASIEAVMHPSRSADLYFVADGTGGHVFSRDYAEHDAAVARWRALTNDAKPR